MLSIKLAKTKVIDLGENIFVLAFFLLYYFIIVAPQLLPSPNNQNRTSTKISCCPFDMDTQISSIKCLFRFIFIRP